MASGTPALDILRVRHVIRSHRAAAAFHIGRVDRADDPHHGHPMRVFVGLQEVVDVLRKIHAAADGVAVGPEMARQALVHDDGAGGRFAIALIERRAPPPWGCAWPRNSQA